ncbi:uncharacterized protein FIBRA_01206 [Fibroporia radiculosa]|uniref:Uncharacterized protein n=1 Tax=Fibroporia radiculosa TaxID=599839 RepID=J4I8C9_9APHY|nr:uncharacterized protein FIBRA_01206 [Fibroporia radiculosa]CCL99191.1 predicted protein [Fibroporia radiculosa]
MNADDAAFIGIVLLAISLSCTDSLPIMMATNVAGARATNTANAAPAIARTNDSIAMHELLDAMRASFGTIDQTFREINEQSVNLSSVGPTMQDVDGQMRALLQEIKEHGENEDSRIKDIKKMIKGDVKQNIAENMKADIKEQIRKELALQVPEEIQRQIADHLPVSLHEQSRECKLQIIEVENALANSKARKLNSTFDVDNLGDTLSVVLRADGTKSGVFPANLNSLFAFDATTLKKLLGDYDIREQESREMNLNKFISHIGVPFRLVSIPAPGEIKNMQRTA